MASSQAKFLNSSYIFLLKFSRKKNDQNRNNVFISCECPAPKRFLSEMKTGYLCSIVHVAQYIVPLRHLEWYLEYWSCVNPFSFKSACEG